MGFPNRNILSWSSVEVAAFLDSIGFSSSGLKDAVFKNSVTGPQLISMTPIEISDSLGATVLQARRIHDEIQKISLGDGGVPANTEDGQPEEDKAATGYETAATAASLAPIATSLDVYGIPSTLTTQRTSSLSPAAATTTSYYPPAVSTAPAQYPLPPHHQPNIYYAPASEPAPLVIPTTAMALAAAPLGQPSPPPEYLKTQQRTYTSVCKRWFPWWMLMFFVLLAVAGSDLGLSIYMNGQLEDATSLNSLDFTSLYYTHQGIYRVHYLDGERFWCCLFFAAQGFTILSIFILLIFQLVVGRRGSLSGVKNLAFATLLVSFIGLALYALPIAKWTYVIASDYSLSEAFSGAAIPTAVFALEWAAVLFWAVLFVMAAVMLGKLSKSSEEIIPLTSSSGGSSGYPMAVPTKY